MVGLPAPIEKSYTGSGRWSLEQILAYEHAVRHEYRDALRRALTAIEAAYSPEHPSHIELRKLLETER